MRIAFMGVLAAQDLNPQQVNSLTVEQVQNLKPKGDGLSFDKLTELSPPVATALAKQNAGLRFGALTSLSPEIAKALAAHKGPLTFTKLSELSVATAQALGSFEGKTSPWAGSRTCLPKRLTRPTSSRRELDANAAARRPRQAGGFWRPASFLPGARQGRGSFPLPGLLSR